jgi:predicted transcriptional regulator
MEALRLLMGEHRQPMLLVVSAEGRMKGIVTKSDILRALTIRRDAPELVHETEAEEYISAS